MTKDEELQEFLATLYRVTISVNWYMPADRDDYYMTIISTINAGEWAYAANDIIGEAQTCGLPLYQWDIDDLKLLWKYLKGSPEDFPYIPVCPKGEGPWGPNNVSQGTPHGY